MMDSDVSEGFLSPSKLIIQHSTFQFFCRHSNSTRLMHDSFQILNKFANSFSVYSPLVAIALGLLYYKHLSPVFQILFYLLVYGFINDVLNSAINPVNNWIYNNVYLFFETIAMGIIMISIEKRLLFKTIIRILIISLVLLFIVTTVYNPTVYLLQFNRLVLPVRSVILSIIAGIMIYDLSGREDYLFRNAAFWVLIGFFIYLFCNVIVMLSISLKLIENTNIINNIWFMHNILSGTSNLIYAYALYLTRRGKYYASK